MEDRNIDLLSIENFVKDKYKFHIMFKIMLSEERLIYSALLASYFIEDITFEELLKKLVLVKNELDNNPKSDELKTISKVINIFPYFT